MMHKAKMLLCHKGINVASGSEIKHKGCRKENNSLLKSEEENQKLNCLLTWILKLHFNMVLSWIFPE